MSYLRNDFDTATARVIPLHDYQNEQHNKQNQHQQQKNNDDSTSSTSTSIDTQPGVFCSKEDLQQILTAYRDLLGDMTANVGWYLEGLIRWGMEPAVIVRAIQETGWARRPTPYYMRAVLERYRRCGIRTLDDLENDKAEFDVRRDEKNIRREWWEG